MSQKPYFEDGKSLIYHGDCRRLLGEMEENSIDAIVTDPPYELGFMNKGWDKTGVANDVAMWKECLRVLKPGGHLLSFGGSRTYHRMASAVEDAGFEIRDQIMWLYGSGFPKSMDVGKAIDKANGAQRLPIGERVYADGTAPRKTAKNFDGTERAETHGLLTAPVTTAAQQWDGWGTALKPAHEPIVVARKPLIGTVAANVLMYGTGALHIDACRVKTEDSLGGGNNSADVSREGKHEGWQRPWMQDEAAAAASAERSRQSTARSEELGRWPANVIHDGSDEVLQAFPDAPGQQRASNDGQRTQQTVYGKYGTNGYGYEPRGDQGSAARFYYTAKASKDDREEGCDGLTAAALAYGNQAQAEVKRGNTGHAGESGMNTVKMRANNHPTVKPTDLMRYLCRLVTAPGGVVLDPFMGSGSTRKAALAEGLRFVGMEYEEKYCRIAARRVVQDVLDFEAVG